MLVAFKNVNNSAISYHVNSFDSFFSVIPKLLVDNQSDPNKYTIKFIYKGKVINHNEMFGEIKEENPTVICLITRLKSTIQSIPDQQIFEEKDDIEDEEFELDPIDKLRAAVIGLLVFVKTDPKLFELFNNNFESLKEAMVSSKIKPLFEKMVSDVCDSNSDYLDDFSKSLVNRNKKLSKNDIDNINILSNLGYTKKEVIKTYFECNKDFDRTSTVLLEK